MNLARYSIRGLIDGSLSVLGVVIGAANPDATIIISAGLAGSLANGLSNLWAAFSAEYAEQYRHLGELESAMSIPLRNTVQEAKLKKEVRRGAAGDALSSLVGGVVPVIPFFFLPVRAAIISSILLVLVMMILLGVVVGRMSRGGIMLAIGKMVAFTLLTAMAAFIVERLVGAH